MANLIVVCGPQAVGKMTVAESLRDKLKYNMMMNHDSIEISDKIFGFATPAQREFNSVFRRTAFELAVKHNVDLLFQQPYKSDLMGYFENIFFHSYLFGLIYDGRYVINLIKSRFIINYILLFKVFVKINHNLVLCTKILNKEINVLHKNQGYSEYYQTDRKNGNR